MKKVRRIICLFVALTMVFSMTTITADAASFKSKPTGVKAKCVSGASVKVSCKAKKGATGYNFYYNTKKGGKYKLGATSTSRSAVVSGLTAGKKYYFKVQAFKGTDVKTYSKMSKAVKCKTVLKKPKAAVTDNCGCKLRFRLSGQDGTKGFVVYRSTKKKKGYKKIAAVSGGPAVTWYDKNVKGSTKYYYKVTAVSGKYSSPESKVVKVKTAAWHRNGNDSNFNPSYSGTSQYAAQYANRNIFFLGSSITYGSASGGVAVPDYLAARNGLRVVQCVPGSGDNNSRITPVAGSGIVWKEAVSGTTMARVGSEESENIQTYSFRLHKYYQDTKINPDIFVCQLSLNDANKGVEVGEYKSIDFERLQGEGADVYLDEELYESANTVAGAIEYITAFAYAKWPDCQVVFYTITRFNGGNSATYIDMMSLLSEETANRINVIDMWNGAGGLAYPSLSGRNLCMFMSDAHHPKKAGYQKWTPYFERDLIGWMPELPTYTVTWENRDTGELLETDEAVSRGTPPLYDGEVPTKEEDENYTYEFAGWVDEEGNKLTPDTVVIGDVTFTAVFEKHEKNGNDTGEGDNVEPVSPGQVDQPEMDNEDVGGEDDPDGGQDDITGIIQSLLRAA